MVAGILSPPEERVDTLRHGLVVVRIVVLDVPVASLPRADWSMGH